MDVTVPCPCEGTPHPDGDTVTLRDKPTLRMGTTAMGWANVQSNREAPTTGDILEVYLREGISDWTFLLDDGSERPVDPENLTWFLEDFETAYPVADKAADLYTDVIFRPLVALIPKASRRKGAGRPSSPSGPTEPSTLATSNSPG